MNERDLNFTLPQGRASSMNLSAPMVIRSPSLAIVKRATLGDTVSLEPGVYAVQSVLPDGTEFEAAFELPEHGEFGPVALEQCDFEVDSERAEEAPSFGDPVPQAGLQGTAAETGTSVSTAQPLRWAIVDNRAVAEQIGNGSSEVLHIAASPAASRMERYLRIQRLGYADLNFALPTSQTEGASVRMAGDPSSWEFRLEDPDAALLLGYLAERRVSQLRDLVMSQGPTWQRLFANDHVKPIAGTVGAYALLLVADAFGSRSLPGWDWSNHIHWSEMLANSHDAPSDGLAIHGELLARQGRHLDALECFARIPMRGLPVFSIGLRLVVNRLLGYRGWSMKREGPWPRTQIARLVNQLGSVAANVDFSHPVLSFTSSSDGRIGTESRDAWGPFHPLNLTEKRRGRVGSGVAIRTTETRMVSSAG